MRQSTKPWVNMVLKIENALCVAINWVSTFLLLGILGSMIWQVICRFVLKLSVPWTDELARYLFISIAYVGAGAAISQEAHVEIALIVSVIKRIKNMKTRLAVSRVIDIVRWLVLLGLALFLFQLAWPYMWQVMAVNQLSAALKLPSWVLVAVLCFGLLSMALHSLLRIVSALGDYSTVVDPKIAAEEGEDT